MLCLGWHASPPTLLLSSIRHPFVWGGGVKFIQVGNRLLRIRGGGSLPNRPEGGDCDRPWGGQGKWKQGPFGWELLPVFRQQS